MLSVAACGDATTASNATTPSAITVSAGAGQTVSVGAAATTPFTVKVVNAGGTAVAGATVTWAITAGGGSLSATASTTDANGVATTTYTAGSAAGTATVTATVSGLSPVSFTATVAANTVSIVSGNAQTMPAGAAALVPFTVKVVNASGTAVAGATVTFTIVSGGGSLSAATATTDATGQATATYTAGATAGTATISAAVAGGSTVTFTTTIAAGGPPGGGTGGPGGPGGIGSVTDTLSGTVGVAAGQLSATCAAQTAIAARTLCAVDAFKATLRSTQLDTLQIAFTATNAARWSNLPVGLVPRNGLRFGSLTATQLQAALAVARAAMSDTGFATFQSIRAADSFLRQTAAGYGEGLYYIAVLGTPSTTSRWLLQFAGHHYAYNLSFNGPGTPTVSAISTPFFIGVEPQAFTLGGVAYAPMQSHKVAMYTMINSLDATQKAAAQLSTQFDDVLLGPGKDFTFPAQQGLAGSSLTAAQKTLVVTAIRQWVRDLPTAESNAIMADYAADSALAKTYVAWSKTTDSTVAGSYVRIDGPRVWIEFACQNGIVFQSQIHFHTIWRDKTRDYGGAISTASIEAAAFARELAAARYRLPVATRPEDWLASR